MFSRIFLVKEHKEDWTHNLHIEIVKIIKDIIKTHGRFNEATNENLLGKVTLVTSEFLTNIYKYEKNIHFFLGVENNEDSLVLHYKFPGKDLSVEKTLARIAEVEQIYKDEKLSKSKDFLLGGKRGFYYYKNTCDRFELKEIDEENFKREIILKFNFQACDL